MLAQLGTSVGQNPRLDALHQFALLPIGAGSKGKAPVDPETGRPLEEWQKAAFTPDQIKAMPAAYVKAIGVRTGVDGLVIIDIDGKSAVDFIGDELFWLNQQYCFRWVIYRQTSCGLKVPHRFKLPFWLTPGQAEELGEAPFSVTTGFDYLREAREGVDLLWHGRQGIVLGQHLTTGTEYAWDGHPDLIPPIDDQWWSILLRLKTEAEAAVPKIRKVTTGAVPRIRGDWRVCNPCPVCGRHGRGQDDCRMHRDGRTIQCHQGVSYGPPVGLVSGELIRGRDGEQWAFTGERERSGALAGRRYSQFVLHQERKE